MYLYTLMYICNNVVPYTYVPPQYRAQDPPPLAPKGTNVAKVVSLLTA